MNKLAMTGQQPKFLNKPAALTLTAAFVFALGGFRPALADVTGGVTLGARNVTVDGSQNKFREDVNYDDGVRLFDVALNYRAEPGEQSLADRIDLNASNLGGDPWESIHLSVKKRGAYDLTLDRRRSQYFYDDVILPPTLASIEGSTGGDFHHFDFERVRDRAALDISVSPDTKVTLNLSRYTRIGESTTTLDIQRDEFDLEKPIDESMNTLSVGVQHAWDNVTLIYERNAREFDNISEIFLAGASTGLNTEDPAELAFFSLDQSSDYTATGDTLRFIARPTDRLDLQGAWLREDLELDMSALELSEGITFGGDPFTRTAAGSADVGRDIEVQSIEFGYAVGDSVRVIGELRRHTLDQRGSVQFDVSTGTGLWDVETTGTRLGLEYAATQRIVLTAGISEESRDTTHASALDSPAIASIEATDRAGFFASVAWEAPGGLHVDASIEDDDIDDAFTLSSPTGARRYRVRARYRWDNGLALNANLRHDVRENDASGWDADTDQANVRLTYDTSRLSLSYGISSIDLSRVIAQSVTGGSRVDLYSIDYDAEAALLDGYARWQISDRIAIGGLLRNYENKGSYPLQRDDFNAFVDVALADEYSVRIGYREIDYREDGFDDYDAELIEAAFGVRW